MEVPNRIFRSRKWPNEPSQTAILIWSDPTGCNDVFPFYVFSLSPHDYIYSGSVVR